jgi:hypothetical protein
MIDLRSDTLTRPTEAMRAAMARAEVGDEQRRADPTVNRLQDRMAELLGKERAIFFPTGTMCNLVAVGAHTRPGDAIVLEHSGHVLRSETSGAAAVNGCVIETIRGDRGFFTPEQLAQVLTPGNQYVPPTRLVCLEQTHNFAGGTVLPLADLQAVRALADEAGVAVHVDGARIWNAHVATGTPFAKAYAHAGMVGYDGEKMSKSRGNLVFVSALRNSDVDPMAIRLTLLRHHYRSDWEWTDAELFDQVDTLDRWRRALALGAGAAAEPVVTGVLVALADDLDAPRAVQLVDAWVDATLGTHGLADTSDPDAAVRIHALLDAALGLSL